jgi:hypothetical protein
MCKQQNIKSSTEISTRIKVETKFISNLSISALKYSLVLFSKTWLF